MLLTENKTGAVKPLDQIKTSQPSIQKEPSSLKEAVLMNDRNRVSFWIQKELESGSAGDGYEFYSLSIKFQLVDRLNDLKTQMQFPAGTDEKGHSLFYQAVITGNTEIVKAIPFQMDFINQISPVYQMNPLFYAVEQGYTGIVRYLLDKGASVQQVEETSGDTLLHTAIRSRRFDIASQLIDRGIKTDEFNLEGNTPLMELAVQFDQGLFQKMIKSVVTEKMNPNTGNTALHRACYAGNETAIRNLARFTRPGIVNHAGLSPVFCAVQLHHSAAVKELLKYEKISGYNRGEPLLTFAVKYGSPEMIQLLLSYRPDLNLADKAGRTPLFYAVAENLTDTVMTMVRAGAALQKVDYKGNTPLDWAAIYYRLEIYSYLRKAGAKDIQNPETLKVFRSKLSQDLFASIHKGNLAQIKLLLTFKPDLTRKNSSGLTPLILALSLKNREICELLIDAKAEINQCYYPGYYEKDVNLIEKTYPVHLAVQNGWDSVLVKMIMRRVNLNVINRYSQNALHLAVIRKDLKTAEILLENQINVNQADYDQKTPLLIALKNQDESMVKLLQKYNPDTNSISMKTETETLISTQ